MYQQKEDGETVTHVSTEEVRSGSSTHVTRYVLGISLVLAIIVLALTLAGGFWKTDETGADNVQQVAPAQSTNE
ncbi:MAG: hypothetical protein ABW039_01250 [Sphingobium sp.]